MTFISKFYLYKCSHFLCSQACTCSYMSQECWYSSHLRHTDEFYPCIRLGLKKRKENNTCHQPRTSYINLDIQRKKIINFVACWLLQVRLIVSLIARRASINPGGVLPIMASTGKLRPNCKRCTSSRLSIVEIHERVGESVAFRSVKGPKRANKRILWLWKSRENFLASFVIYSQFKDSTFTAAKSNEKF